MTLSIIIPCYNERGTIAHLLQAIDAVNLHGVEKDVVIVDDCSTDGTREYLRALAHERRPGRTLLFHDRNLGKGSALRTGLQRATGDIILIQDADLEYDPTEYPELIEPIVRGRCSVVYGSRERNQSNRTHSGTLFYAGGLLLTWLTNILYGSDLTDEPCCYKVFSAALLRSIPLTCRRFEFCPEVTAKILRRGVAIREVPVTYRPRTVEGGKKIRFRDGLEALWTLLKYRFKRVE